MGLLLLPGGAVASSAAFGGGEFLDLDQGQVCYFADDHLGYPVAVLYLKGSIRVEQVHGNQYLAPVVAVYRPEGDSHSFC